MRIISPKRLMESVFPTVRNGGIFNTSSLDLQFARTKTLDPRITFTRASSGTYVGSDGLIKTATTNNHLRSEDLANWGTPSEATVSSNVTTAPDGALTADKLVETTANAAHFLSSTSLNFSYTSGTTYTRSCWLKAAGRTFTSLYFPGTVFPSTGRTAVFNLSTGAVVSTESGVTASITAFANGWYRCSITAAATTTGSGHSGGSTILLDASTSTYTGDGTSGVFVWGAQLEQSSTVGEYIPTTSTINSAPRFDHNPTTGESLGLLVEEQRTNLQGNSELLTAASWALSNVTIAASGTGPNGGTAYEVTEATATNNHSFAGGGVSTTGTTSVTSGSTYTGSIFLKRSTVDWIQLSMSSTGFGTTLYINFNLATGAVGNSSGCTGTITPFANGWYRCTITATASTTTSATNNVIVAFTNNTNTTSRAPSYAGSTANKLFATMGQFELGSFATSYIPTTTSSVTRSADVASITGANFSSWYNQTAGTVFAEYRTPASGTRGVVGFNDNTANERIALYTSGTDPKLTVVDGGVTQADINGGTVTASVMTKSAGAFAANDFALAHAGGAAVADTSGTMPTPDRVLIGADQAGNYQNGRIRRLTYWPTRLPNSTLQEITR